MKFIIFYCLFVSFFSYSQDKYRMVSGQQLVISLSADYSILNKENYITSLNIYTFKENINLNTHIIVALQVGTYKIIFENKNKKQRIVEIAVYYDEKELKQNIAASEKKQLITLGDEQVELYKYQEALELFLEFDDITDYDQNRKMSELYFILKQEDKGFEYLRRNLNQYNDLASRDFKLFLDKALELENQDFAYEAIKNLYILDYLPRESDFVKLFKLFVNHKNYIEYVSNIYISKYENYKYFDTYLYFKATFLKNIKELTKASVAYREIIENYPLSSYYNSVKQEINFLKRYF